MAEVVLPLILSTIQDKRTAASTFYDKSRIGDYIPPAIQQTVELQIPPAHIIIYANTYFAAAEYANRRQNDRILAVW